jgi:Flp pilus assembly pilin Flp
MIAIRRMWADDDAQDVVEYGLITILIAVALISIVTATGNPVANSWNAAVNTFTSAV